MPTWILRHLSGYSLKVDRSKARQELPADDGVREAFAHFCAAHGVSGALVWTTTDKPADAHGCSILVESDPHHVKIIADIISHQMLWYVVYVDTETETRRVYRLDEPHGNRARR